MRPRWLPPGGYQGRHVEDDDRDEDADGLGAFRGLVYAVTLVLACYGTAALIWLAANA